MLALYIHLPFCRKKCLYCSFAVAVAQNRWADLYLDCLAAEAKAYRHRRLETIYIGGGTPSLLKEYQLGRLFQMVKTIFDCSSVIELTIEVNPEDITLQKAVFLKSNGISRVSLGVQTFDDQHLQFLGRAHSAAQAIQAYDILRRAGFENINVDMMYALPRQTRRQLAWDMQIIQSLQPDHVSYYALTIECPSRLHVIGTPLPDDTRQAADYDNLTLTLAGQGLRQYEISNFARAGKESRHNINYWRMGNYIGLGLSAHSHFDGRRCWNTDRLKEYMNRMQKDATAVSGREELTPPQRLSEALVFGLRMNAGLDLMDLEKRFSVGLDDDTRKTIRFWVAHQFLRQTGTHISTTHKGRLVLDEISSRLI